MSKEREDCPDCEHGVITEDGTCSNQDCTSNN